MPSLKTMIVIVAKDSASRVFGNISKSAANMGRKLDASSDSIVKVGQGLSTVGSTMTKAITLPLVAFAGVAVNSAMQADRMKASLTGHSDRQP